MLGARFELEDVSDIREVIDALRALHRAVHGMDVVKAIEAVGSQSGKTAKPVVIADSGQIS